jgi:hypothetical protein
MKTRAGLVLCVALLSLGGVAMGEFKSPRDTALGDVVSTWPAHLKAYEDSVIEASGQAADTPFVGRILARLDDKGVANGIASLGADGKVPAAQLPAAGSFSGASAYTSVPVACPGETIIPLNQERFDTDSYHSNTVNNSRLTLPTTGYYQVNAGVAGGLSVDGGMAFVYIRLNGVTQLSWGGTLLFRTNGQTLNIEHNLVAYFNAGDYLELDVLPLVGTVSIASGSELVAVRLGS